MKISVIIPVYNAEKYLDRCLQSVCDQTYKNIEIIIINDGSKDNSLQKCNEWADKDNRIKVFSKENEGQGKARNIGLDNSEGEYICFVDSDDYIHPQMLELLIKTATEFDSDLVQCKYTEVDEGQEVEPPYIEYDNKFINLTRPESEQFLCYYTDDIIPWNKFFKKVLFNQRRFPEGMYYEDKHLMFRLRYYAKKIVYLDIPLYYYVQSSNSTMRNDLDDKRLKSMFRLMDELAEFCKKEKLKADYDSEMSGNLRTLLSIYYRTKKNPEFSDYHKKSIEMLKEYLPEWQKNPYIVGKYRWIVKGMKINFYFTLWLFCIANKIRKEVA